MSLMFLAPFVGCAAGKGPVTWDAVTLVSTNAQGVTCYATVEINTDGRVYSQGTGANQGSFTTTTVDRGGWLNPGYTASDYYVERGSLSGTPGTLNHKDEFGSRVQINADREASVQETSTLDTHSCIFDIYFYDAPSGGNLLETVSGFELRAFKDTP